MNALRSTWGRWWTTALLCVGLLPMVVVWPDPGVMREASTARAHWLRAQVRAPLSEAERGAFEQAIEEAAEAEAASLQAYVEAFADAYTGRADAHALADVFGARDLAHVSDGTSLYRYLERHARHVAEGVLAPRLVSAVAAAHPSVHRAGVLVAHAGQQAFARTYRNAVRLMARAVPHTVRVRILSSARPLGP